MLDSSMAEGLVDVKGAGVCAIDAHSVYIHIPFCVRKCAYCDFLSFPDCVSRMDEYVRALCREIRLSPVLLGNGSKTLLRTVYFGGGTPSLLSGKQVAEILLALKEGFTLSEDCEITLEANPGTIDAQKLRAFYDAGINRISLGIQSLDDSVLRTLGRIHNADTARNAISMVKAAGFTNISCDMMLGIPGQTLESVKATVGELLERGIPHVSLYSLILEEGTPMYARYGGDIEKCVTQEADREMYHEVIRSLTAKGYTHYEISNMARPGFESRHNLMYWRAEQYYGFGVGAHYYLGKERGRHVETLDEYLNVLGDSNLGSREIRRDEVYYPEETLTQEDCMKEFVMLGFRMGSGVDTRLFQERFGMNVEGAFATELKQEQAKGLVVAEGGAYRLTEKGFDLANQVFMDYV